MRLLALFFVVWLISSIGGRLADVWHKHLAEKRRLRTEREHFVDLMAARAKQGPYR